MLRTVALVGFLAVQAGVFLVGPSLFAADPPPFLKVMEDNFSGKKNVHKAVKRQIDADATDWGELARLMKQYATAAGYVGAHAKTKPEKGDDKSWAKLTAQFAGQAKELEAAVTAKDKEKAKATLEKLNETCEACHEAHR
jgi:predicted TIM-barrel fold metal-dependent hydrolase